MSDVLFLVVPKKELDKVIALPGEESLTKVRDEIQVISCSSEVGASLFQAAWRTMVLEQIGSTIEKSVTELLGLPKIDALALITHINKWNGLLEEIPGLGVVTGKRDVKFTYRGMPFVMAVRSVQEQHEWGLKTALRAAAAAQGVIPELQLFTSGRCDAILLVMAEKTILGIFFLGGPVSRGKGRFSRPLKAILWAMAENPRFSNVFFVCQ